MKSKQAQIVFLQEIHLESREHDWVGSKNVFFFLSQVWTEKGGRYPILLSGKLHFEKVFEKSDWETYFSKGKHGGNSYHFVQCLCTAWK